jgi:hypothetical protein
MPNSLTLANDAPFPDLILALRGYGSERFSPFTSFRMSPLFFQHSNRGQCQFTPIHYRKAIGKKVTGTVSAMVVSS